MLRTPRVLGAGLCSCLFTTLTFAQSGSSTEKIQFSDPEESESEATEAGEESEGTEAVAVSEKSDEVTDAEAGDSGASSEVSTPHDPSEDWAAYPEEEPREPFQPTFQKEEPSEARPHRGAFAAHNLRVGLGFGGAADEEERWLILTPSVGYFLLHGLEVHVDASFWVIGEPFLFAPSPGVRYVFHMVPLVKPYLGGFYRHYVVTGSAKDGDSFGARGGLLFMAGATTYFGGGVIYERLLTDAVFQDQNQIYPEVTFSLTF